MSQNQNWISVRFSSGFSVGFFFFWIRPPSHDSSDDSRASKQAFSCRDRKTWVICNVISISKSCSWVIGESFDISEGGVITRVTKSNDSSIHYLQDLRPLRLRAAAAQPQEEAVHLRRRRGGGGGSGRQFSERGAEDRRGCGLHEGKYLRRSFNYLLCGAYFFSKRFLELAPAALYMIHATS